MTRFARPVAIAALGGCLAASADCAAHRASPASTMTAPDAASAEYPALGAGHLLKSVSADGRYVTLEDGSVWEIEPSARFQTAEWQAEASMSVGRSVGLGVYTYSLVNTQDDEGALARYVKMN